VPDLSLPIASVLSLADWHDTKAEKARRFPGPLERNEDVMRGKATVHDDAARRLRELVAPVRNQLAKVAVEHAPVFNLDVSADGPVGCSCGDLVTDFDASETRLEQWADHLALEQLGMG
jgi:hypothetical protein